MAEGIAEQAEDLERLNGGEETTQSLALRDSFGQMVKVAEHTDERGVTDWPALDDEVGIDLDPVPEQDRSRYWIDHGIGCELRRAIDDEGADYVALGELARRLLAATPPPVPPVYMVEPPFALEREACAFWDHGDAVAYADAVSRPDEGAPDGFGEADTVDFPINGPTEAATAIAVERARYLEDTGFDGVAEDVEQGKRALAGVAEILRETIGLGGDEDTEKALATVEHWIEIDAAHRPHTTTAA
ncbi:MAG: hypothetical protein JSS97_08255 [Actinobacteria bacterium]|nr:hypothetical protein [Actinomycetota bacterium]